MPPAKKIDRDDILKVAYRIADKEEFENINARRIAKELGCSVQPIFHNFTSMEELKNATIEKIHNTYEQYMEKGSKEKLAYKGMGMAYIRFAKEHPKFFKVIFMRKTSLTTSNFIRADNTGNDVIKMGQILTGFDEKEQIKFHTKVWIFTHGLALLVANNSFNLNEEEIRKLLETTVRELLIGYKKNNEGKKEE